MSGAPGGAPRDVEFERLAEKMPPNVFVSDERGRRSVGENAPVEQHMNSIA